MEFPVVKSLTELWNIEDFNSWLRTKKFGGSKILLNGPIGTGKTTSALIGARIQNCKNPDWIKLSPCSKCVSCKQSLWPIHLTAGSVKLSAMIKKIDLAQKYSPTYNLNNIVIDEIHMLDEREQTLLHQLLDHPPKHFSMFVTTSKIHHLTEAFCSRFFQIDYRRPSFSELADYCKKINAKFSVTLSEKQIHQLIKDSNGIFRSLEIRTTALCQKVTGGK